MVSDLGATLGKVVPISRLNASLLQGTMGGGHVHWVQNYKHQGSRNLAGMKKKPRIWTLV